MVSDPKWGGEGGILKGSMIGGGSGGGGGPDGPIGYAACALLDFCFLGRLAFAGGIGVMGIIIMGKSAPGGGGGGPDVEKLGAGGRGGGSGIGHMCIMTFHPGCTIYSHICGRTISPLGPTRS